MRFIALLQKVISIESLFASLLLLGGCGLIPVTPGHWVHPANPTLMILHDHLNCANDSWTQYPEKKGVVSAEDGYFAPATNASSTCTTYRNQITCIHTPAMPRRWVPSGRIEGDENAKSRNSRYVNCMTTISNTYRCFRDGIEVSGDNCGTFVQSEYAPIRWQRIGKTGSGNDIYADRDTIRRAFNNTAKMWDMLDYKTTQVHPSRGNRFLSLISLQEYDCKDKRLRVLYYSFHSENMGNGNTVLSYEPSEWGAVGSTETIGGTFWEIACGKQ